MTDHMVSGHVRIFPNPRRSAYETSGCSKDISRIQLKVSILKYPAPVIKLKRKQVGAELCQAHTRRPTLILRS